MENPSLQIGGGDWAVKETKLLGTNPVLNRKIPVEIDVTNATIGTRVNKEGIIENGPKNLLTFSEDFSNSIWSKNDLTLEINSAMAPNETLTADKIVPNSNNVRHELANYNLAQYNGLTITISAYVKNSGHRYVSIGTLDQGIIFDFNTNSFSNLSAGSSNAFTQTLANGWYRIGCTINSLNNNRVAITSSPIIIATTNGPFISDQISGTYVWGVQMEQGSIATEYYPTTTRTNLARIDYSSGEASLLIEPQSTNLLRYSEDFSNVSWQKQNSPFFNKDNAVSPNGTITADTLTIFPIKYIYQQLSITSGLVYTFSFYVKVITGTNQFKINIFGGGNNFISTLKTATTNWQRFDYTFTSTGTGACGFYPVLVDGLSGGDFQVWGAQVEQGSYATSYIPTVASAVTRNADLISKTGISSLINSQEGVLLFEGSALFNDLTQRAISITDGTNNNIVKFFYHNYLNRINYISISLFKGGNNITNIDYTLTFDETLNAKFAFRFKENEFSLWVNGLMVGQRLNLSTFFSLNTLNVLELNTQPFRGKINQLQLYKTALTDAQLITLTTI
jgi:hypothetical protein